MTTVSSPIGVAEVLGDGWQPAELPSQPPAASVDEAAARGTGPMPLALPFPGVSSVDARRLCEWCRGPIDTRNRRDANTCSKACRQAKARFRVGRASSAATSPIRVAYADPPYPGCASYYDGQRVAQEVNHAILIGTLTRDFPHGWALSTSEDGLQQVLAVCPPGVRVAAWVKGGRRGLSRRARNAWEPVILWRGRELELGPQDVLDDVLIWGGRQPSHPGALIGMKPAPFAEWLFRQLGLLRGDTLVDVFPGSGAVGRAWNLFCRAEQLDGGAETSCLAGAARRLEGLLEAESAVEGDAEVVDQVGVADGSGLDRQHDVDAEGVQLRLG